MASKQELELQVDSMKEEILDLREKLKKKDEEPKVLSMNYTHPSVTIIKDDTGIYLLKMKLDVETGEAKVYEKIKIPSYEQAHHFASKFLSEEIIIKYMRGEKLK